MNRPIRSVALDMHALDRLMPMHLLISPTGHIQRAGPTLAKLRPDAEFAGRRFLEIFELRRPRSDIPGKDDLARLVGCKLRLVFRNEPRTALKGILVEMPGTDMLMVNLSFGISVVEAIRDYALSSNDFAPTDLTVEMLYLFEAKTIVMEESRDLNLRLDQARKSAEQQAGTDALTGLKNRRAMDQVLAGLVISRTGFGLMHLDLDFFKQVNDTFGHAAGDEILKFAADILLDETRAVDLVARVGGDEFVLIFVGLVDTDQLIVIAERIVARLEQPIEYQGNSCAVSGSIGITTSEFYEKPDPDRMLSDADVALYASKHKGRACATLAAGESRRKPGP